MTKIDFFDFFEKVIPYCICSKNVSNVLTLNTPT
jgi:hypothetical protein